MKAETLKKSILQYAMEGKLVPQNPDDEPASELLKRIKTEKDKLIKEGKIKKDKNESFIFKGEDNKYYEQIGSKTIDITEEIPFEIPDSWEWVRLRELTLLYNGKAFKPSDWTSSGLPIVRIQNLNNPNAPFNYYNGNVDENFILYGDELLFAWSGTPGTSFGAHIWNGNKAVLNQHIFKLVFNEEYIYKKYFMYALNYRVEELIVKAHGAVGLQHVTKNVVEGTLIPFPPYNEQKRIVNKLEKLIEFVKDYRCSEEKLNELNKTLPDKIKQSILQYAVQGKLVEQNPSDIPAKELLKQIKAEKERLIKEGKIRKDKKESFIYKGEDNNYYEQIGSETKCINDEIPFDIPDSWEWSKIRNLAFVTKLAGFEYTEYVKLEDTGDIPVIRAQNVKPAKLNLTNLKYIDFNTSMQLERSALTKKCLLVTFIGAGIGDVALFDQNKRFHLAPNVAKVEFYCTDTCINNKYALYYLLSPFGNQEIFKFLKATAQPSLSMDTIREIYIPLPPIKEQEKIILQIEKLLNICNALK